MFIGRVWNVYRESVDWVKGESGLCIRRVWTVYRESMDCV